MSRASIPEDVARAVLKKQLKDRNYEGMRMLLNCRVVKKNECRGLSDT